MLFFLDGELFGRGDIGGEEVLEGWLEVFFGRGGIGVKEVLEGWLEVFLGHLAFFSRKGAKGFSRKGAKGKGRRFFLDDAEVAEVGASPSNTGDIEIAIEIVIEIAIETLIPD